jgi:hypothetical protein
VYAWVVQQLMAEMSELVGAERGEPASEERADAPERIPGAQISAASNAELGIR